MNGEWMYYHENGQKKLKGHYKNGDGSYLENWPDSLSVISISPPFDGRSGRWSGWYEDGQKEGEGTYKDGEYRTTSWHRNGQKWNEIHGDGDFFRLTWFDKGQKYREVTSKDGELISIKCWDEDRNECEECSVLSWEGCK